MVGSFPRLTLVCLACLALLVTACAADPPTTPVYARIALPPDGTQTMLLKLRSDGQCKLRNVLFVDTNCDGDLALSEKSVGKFSERKSKAYTYGSCMFPEVSLALSGGDCTGTNALTIGSSYTQLPKKPLQENSYVMINSALERGGEKWNYMSYCGIRPSSSVNCPPTGKTGDLKLMLETQPDKDKAGNTGFAVRVTGQDLMVAQISKDGKPCPVALKVTGPDGKVVHEDAADMSKMQFG